MSTLASEYKNTRRAKALEMVKELRERFNISQYRIANAIGVNWETIWRWFKKGRTPQESKVLALERLYRNEVNRHARKSRKKSKTKKTR